MKFLVEDAERAKLFAELSISEKQDLMTKVGNSVQDQAKLKKNVTD